LSAYRTISKSEIARVIEQVPKIIRSTIANMSRNPSLGLGFRLFEDSLSISHIDRILDNQKNKWLAVLLYIGLGLPFS